MSAERADRDALADELSNWPIGSGYYRTEVAYDEACDMADAILAAGWVSPEKHAKVLAERDAWKSAAIWRGAPSNLPTPT